MSGIMAGLIAGIFSGLALACAWLWTDSGDQVAPEVVWIDEALERAMRVVNRRLPRR